MRTKNGADMRDFKDARHKYEMLRANALGNINRASEFTLFLCNGMSAWLRASGGRDCASQQTSAVFTETDIGMSRAGLASILTDVILNTAGDGRHSRGSI
jgi:hypothetical protein